MVALGMNRVDLCKEEWGVIVQGDSGRILSTRGESVRVELSDIHFSKPGVLS